MSKRYTFAALAAAMAMFAAPAAADGYPDRPVQKGPPPLQAHAPVTDCVDTWTCGPVETYGATTRRYVDHSKTRHYVNRYTTGGKCCTPTAAPAPRPRRVVQRVAAPRGISIDTSGFGGGVGAGVSGGYGYGGGTSFAYARASSSASASAMASASARLTFRGGFKGKWGGGGCRGGCGKGGGKGGHH